MPKASRLHRFFTAIRPAGAVGCAAYTGGELDLNPALLERGRAQELNFRPGPAASLDIYDPGLSRSIPPDLNDLGLPAPLADRRFLQRLHDPESGKDLKPDLILACQREL
jgi:hypothetical protein